MNEPKMAMSPEMEALKTKLKATWTAGDFGQIAQSYAPGAAEFIERLDLQSGEKVLDVACGTGNLSIPAARAGASVTGVDIAPNLIEQARKIAESEGVNCQFDEGDAEALPYADGSFDTVITMFGAMFAPRPNKVAEELMRVCRSSGRIAMANWTPTGFIGKMFKLTGSYVPPPNMPSPVLWGDEAAVRERLKEGISDLQLNRRMITFNFPFSPKEVVEFFRTYYGPTQKAFAALDRDKDKQTALRRELENLWEEHNKATGGATAVESEYLEVIAKRE
ncbi:MAG: class I SAM-dependent methyltransferase [Acidobacteria bacterium]|nr:class I SAM-dependent methyltransferase [Acidobacteriota bacterium]MCA1639635.1 class I SAM-dependent methyltransferase [Acidobacteriota bacterium]